MRVWPQPCDWLTPCPLCSPTPLPGLSMGLTPASSWPWWISGIHNVWMEIISHREKKCTQHSVLWDTRRQHVLIWWRSLLCHLIWATCQVRLVIRESCVDKGDYSSRRLDVLADLVAWKFTVTAIGAGLSSQLSWFVLLLQIGSWWLFFFNFW